MRTFKSMDQLKAGFNTLDRSNSDRPNNYYPFWNMLEGQSAVIRFLPDADEDNPLDFLFEKSQHILVINGEEKKVPCLKMYGHSDCPICKVSSGFYRDGDKETGKQYYKKRQHLAQALIVEDPLPVDPETGENSEGKVKLLTINYQLFNVIKDTYEELDEVPYAYIGGTDFVIKKTKQGEYASYATSSNFARKSSNLTPEQIEYVEENMVELKSLIPQEPSYEKVETMLQAALNGSDLVENDAPSFDGEDENDTPVVTKPKKSSKATVDEPVADENIDTETDDILAAIKKRHKAKA